SHPGVWAIAEDREGNLWIGTRGGGLNRLHPSRAALHEIKEGLRVGSVVSMCEDTEGKLWLATRDGGLVRAVDFSNRSFETLPDWLGTRLITVLCRDPAGGIWVGCDGAGLWRWRDGVFSQTALNERIASLLVDRRGDLWVGTMRGELIRWRDGMAERIPAA